MKKEMLQAVNDQWGQCSQFIKTALYNRFQAIQAIFGKQDWLGYLAGEFGLLREGH